MQRLLEKPDVLKDALRAFENDGQKGILSVRELSHILLNVGDKLSAEELAVFIAEADKKKTGKITVPDAIKLLSCGK